MGQYGFLAVIVVVVVVVFCFVFFFAVTFYPSLDKRPMCLYALLESSRYLVITNESITQFVPTDPNMTLNDPNMTLTDPNMTLTDPNMTLDTTG